MRLRVWIITLMVITSMFVAHGQDAGRITTESPEMRILLNASSGAEVRIEVHATSGDLLPYIALRRTGVDGGFVARSDVSEFGRVAALETGIAEAGNYELIVTRAQEGLTGDFAIQIQGAEQVSFNGTFVTQLLPYADMAYPAVVFSQASGTLTGVLNHAHPVIYHVIYLRPGQRLNARLDRTDGNLRPTLVVTTTGLDTVLARGDISDPTTSVVTYRAARGEWVVLVAARFDGASGSTSGRYMLSVNE